MRGRRPAIRRVSQEDRQGREFMSTAMSTMHSSTSAGCFMMGYFEGQAELLYCDGYGGRCVCLLLKLDF